MVIGYVLISTRTGMEKVVFERLKAVGEIVEICPLFGEFDIIAKVEVKTHNRIGYVVINKIRAVDGVLDTKTLMAVDFPK